MTATVLDAGVVEGPRLIVAGHVISLWAGHRDVRGFYASVRRVRAAILGAGFAASTLVGFLVSVDYGLFGFKDAWSAPFAHQAFVIELVTILVLALAGLLCFVGSALPERI
ncbi:MAG: hypothetical protein ACRDYE_05085 [Acidimicrobiales bacterium]